MKVVIVESPTKMRKISTILGKGYEVLATYGHIRDLPQDSMGFRIEDIKNGVINPYFKFLKGKFKVIKFLRERISRANEVFIATDPDREGEAIGWHIKDIFKLKNPKRVFFHEITKKAILSAFQNPREIDMDLVRAQFGRRILDRIVGYTLSPIFWSLRSNSSAGRVQSAVLHLIVERWKEHTNFKPEKFYEIVFDFKDFKSKLEENGKVKRFLSKEEAEKIAKEINSLTIVKKDIEKKFKEPFPPYTTSSLLQDAKRLLGFSSGFTMFLAQSLFERGFITYHRTDSVNISDEGFNLAKEFLPSDISAVPRFWKSKIVNAQEAHEAIRPTEDGFKKIGDKPGDKPEDKLLELIKKRFLASQSKSAVYEVVEIKFLVDGTKFNSTAKAKRILFDGFLRIWKKEKDDEENESLFNKFLSFSIGEKFHPKILIIEGETEPPPLFTEATLIKKMEELGIGRPSTYSKIIETLKKRKYIVEKKGKIIPTEDGIKQDQILSKNFPEIVSPEFTADMEEKLDLISEGKLKLENFLINFTKDYMEKIKIFREKISELKAEYKKSELIKNNKNNSNNKKK